MKKIGHKNICKVCREGNYEFLGIKETQEEPTETPETEPQQEESKEQEQTSQETKSSIYDDAEKDVKSVNIDSGVKLADDFQIELTDFKPISEPQAEKKDLFAKMTVEEQKEERKKLVKQSEQGSRMIGKMISNAHDTIFKRLDCPLSVDEKKDLEEGWAGVIAHYFPASGKKLSPILLLIAAEAMIILPRYGNIKDGIQKAKAKKKALEEQNNYIEEKPNSNIEKTGEIPKVEEIPLDKNSFKNQYLSSLGGQ